MKKIDYVFLNKLFTLDKVELIQEGIKKLYCPSDFGLKDGILSNGYCQDECDRCWDNLIEEKIEQ